MGQAPPSAETNTDGVGTPFYRSGEFGHERPVTRIWTTKPHRIASKSDVFVCVVGANSGAVNLGADGAIGRSVAAITPGSDLDQNYLFHFLTSLTMTLRGGTQGSAQGVITKADLRAINVPLPRLGEQLRIVEILEDHLSRLDAADRTLRTSLARLDRLVPSVLAQHLHSMHERGVPLGAIGDLADTALGKMLDAKRIGGTPTRYLANINVRWGTFELDHLKDVPLTDVERKKFELRPGDILACEGGEPGRCAVWQLEESDIAYQKALHRIRVRNKNALEPRFLALMLQEGIQSHRWNSLFTGTTIKHLPQEKLRRITVPIPPISTQLSVVGEVEDTQQHVARLARATAEARARGSRLRQAVLTAAFRGKLTGRRIDQEIIEELAAIPAGPSEAMATA